MMFVCYYVRMRCTFGELREVGESSSLHNPGLGPRFLSIDKYNIDVARRESQHCSQHYSYYDYEYINDM